ncbi:Golgi SNAP receptor complex member 1-like [Paramacrobiotus metropolitanus]|uniref:Golgi SNAP receptor complex member 1-like n=1 Tax=Paramacrobiotus metropolitanus TaxID=2943436 RepID=UPI00244617BF|nr:Golgi SNAP receptor complex member 1-like [Paramacrobiotus metropolitanus]
MQQIPMSSWPSSKWEDLRKQARTLENEIDSKLVSFSKLSSQHAATSNLFPRPDSFNRIPSEENIPLINATDDNRVFDALASEIESHLAKLSGINDQMADCMERFSSSPGAALLHTLQRHRDILQDYLQEFNKTKANFEQLRAREELFGPLKLQSGSSRNRPDPYLKEHEHLRNSEKMVEDQIGIAVMTKENLASQRNSLRNVVGRLGAISNRFPSVNGLMQKINFRKRRDAIILGTVIGICLFIIMVILF